MTNPISTDPKSYHSSAAPIDAVLSQLAQKQLQTMATGVKEEISGYLAEVPVDVAKQKIENRMMELANIVFTDVDGADGKYDGHINKRVAQLKMNAAKNILSSSPIAFASAVFKEVEDFVNKMPELPHNKEIILNRFSTVVHKVITKNITPLDCNKDGMFDFRDAAAFQLKLQLNAFGE